MNTEQSAHIPTSTPTIKQLRKLTRRVSNTIPAKDRINQIIEYIGHDKTLDALDRQLIVEEEISRLNATDGPLKDWAEVHALLEYHGIDQELQGISRQVFALGNLLHDARISRDDVVMDGVYELLRGISRQIDDIAGGRLSDTLLPTEITPEEVRP